MPGTVRALFVAPERKSKVVSCKEVVVADGGFAGDFHNKGPVNRQILMISEATLDELGLTPGAIQENIVVHGLDVMAFNPGQQLRIGNTILEVTEPCEPCGQMNRIRNGLKQALTGRRGMFVKVVETGTIRVGDTVSI